MSKEQRNVILVEDDLTVLHSLRLQMREILPSHYRIETANDGDEALEVLSEIVADGGLVPIIVTDHQMPRMTGSEFLIKVRHLVPKCRNIMLTGEAGLTDITKLINEQALFRYLSKPWIQTDLEMTVLSALESFNQEYKLEKLNYELAETNANLEKLVEERTAQLLDKTQQLNSGIEFATLMQESLLPSKEAFSSFFRKADLLFRPHSNVSGDFYSFTKHSETKAMVILGDATGHGLAGAFLSSICVGIIDNLVANQALQHPKEVLADILTRFRYLSSNASKTMKEMISVELTVLCVDKALGTCRYASNSKQLIFMMDSKVITPKEENFECCLGNKQSAKSLKRRGKSGEVSLQQIDTIILYSDGVTDQFIEASGRKLGRKALVSALQSIPEQGLEQWFSKLQGQEPNTDDATMLFLKP